MTKSTVIKTWIGGLVTMAAGLLVAGISVFVMLVYGGHFTPAPYGANGYDFVPSLDGVFWTTVAVIVLGGALALVGGVIQLAAWVGALVNTNRLPDKTWFAVLLFGGLLGVIFAPIGFAAMVAYVLAGPEATAVSPAAPVSPAPSTTLAPTT